MWDTQSQTLRDSAPKVLFNKMPYIWLKPIVQSSLIITNVVLLEISMPSLQDEQASRNSQHHWPLNQLRAVDSHPN